MWKAGLAISAVVLIGAVIVASRLPSDGSGQVHQNIPATVFWVGEPPSDANAQISNGPSAWDDQWMRHFGGVDDPDHRTADSLWPAGFAPKENPFYVALPYNEYTDDGTVKPSARLVPWYDPRHPPTSKRSNLKNHWVRVERAGRVVYAQWEDAGPMVYDDTDYVFGSARPAYKSAGIDLSPAVANFLYIGGRNGGGRVSWSFVDASQVPDGPWKRIVTTRQVSWR